MPLQSKSYLRFGCVFLGLFYVFSFPVHATDFTVTNTNDSGAGSLRNAIDSANSASGGSHQVLFQVDLSGTITLQSSLPTITTKIITIAGPSSGSIIIDGDSTHQGFFIEADVVVAISNLSLQNMRAKGGNGGPGRSGGGGALGAGGAIFVESGADVSISSVAFGSCSAVGGDGGTANTGIRFSGGGGGGGMRNAPGGDVTQSLVSNIGGGGGGGLEGSGGNAQSGGSGGGGKSNRGGDCLSLALITDVGGGGGGGSGENPGETGDIIPGGNGGDGFESSSGGQGGTTAGQDGALGTSGGGGGGGASNIVGASGSGGSGSTPGGGGGGAGTTLLSTGSTTSGTGGGGGKYGGGGGGGGALTSISASVTAGSGGNGGYGSGGGGGGGALVAAGIGSATGGSGGNSTFGGGGGGGGIGFGVTSGGNGGFGGGGGGSGGSTGLGGTAGFGGGNGGNSSNRGGGAGAGLGGAIFIEGSGLVTFSGSGTLFSSNSTTAGTGSDGGADGTASGDDLFIQSGAEIVFAVTDTVTIGSDIASNQSSGGSFSKSNTGTLNLTGNNTFTGNISVSGGTLSIISDNALGVSTNAVSISSGAVLNLSSDMSSSRALTLGSGGGVLNISPSFTTTWSGNISESAVAGFTKDGTGILTLSGTNTYSGGTNINAGTLRIANDNLLGSVGGGVTFGGGTLHTTATLSTGRSIALSGNGTFEVDTSTSLTCSGAISGSGLLTKLGSGNLILTGSNSYTGGNVVSAGVLQGDTTNILGDIANAGSVVFDQGSTGTFSGDISGAGSVTKQGAGTLILSGSNSYSGGTTISAGALQGDTTSLTGNITNSGSLVFDQESLGTFSGDISGTGSVRKQGTGMLIFSGSNSYSGGFTISEGALQGDTTSLTGNITTSGSLVFDQGSTGTFSGDISGTGSLTKQGTGVLILSGTNSYSGGTNINAGTLCIANDSLLGDIGGGITFGGGNLNTTATLSTGRSIALSGNGTFEVDTSTSLTCSGAISGSGLLTKLGSGNLILTGSNSYTGGNVVSAGVLQGDTGSILGNIANTGSVIFNQGTTGAFSGDISGTGSITKQGAGTLILSGSNSYSGGTTISAGALQGDTTSLTGNITNSSSLVFDQESLGTFSGDISGTGSVTKQGAGTLILSGSNSYSGGTTISVGALQGNTTSLTGDITNNSSLVFNQISTGTFLGDISGTGSVTKRGTGVLILSGTNTYSGGTNINAGTLRIANDSLLGSGEGGVTFGGGNLNTTDTFSTARNIALSGNGAFEVDASTSLTCSGDIGGSGSLTKLGSGNLILTGSNSYTGGNIVSAGILQGDAGSISGNIANAGSIVFNQESLGTFSGDISGIGSVTKQGAGTLILSGSNSYSAGTTISAGTLQGDTTSLTGDITDNASLVFTQSSTGTFLGDISGTGSVTKQGAGTLILSGSNSYSAGTTISAGALQGNTASLVGNITNNSSLIFDQGTTGTFSGDISGTGSVTKQGTGVLILSGTNTYSGGTNINAGVLRIANDNLLGDIGGGVTFGGGTLHTTATLSTGRSIALSGNGTFEVNTSTSLTCSGAISGSGLLTKLGSGNLILTGSNSYTGGNVVSAGVLQGDTNSILGDIANAGSVVFDQGSSGTFSGDISGTGSVTKQGAGTLILSGSNSYSAGTTISAGALQGNANSIVGNITNNSSLIFDQGTTGTFSGNISGTGSVTKQGVGTLTFSGSNSYSGGTTISGGALQGNTGTIAGNITNNSSLIFDQGSNGTFSGDISGTGSVTKQGAGTLILSGSNSYSGGTTISGGALQGNTGTIAGNITNNSSLIFDQGTTGTFSGDISGTGSVTKQGAGRLILGGSSSYTGGTSLNAGILQVFSGSALGNSIGEIDFAGGSLNTTGTFTLPHNVSLSSEGIFEVDTSTTLTCSGVISGNGSLTKLGNGSLVLTGSNTYLGGASVSQGVLEGNTTSLFGNTVNNAVLRFNQNFSGSYGGIVTGTGTLVKTGSGKSIFSGNLTQNLFSVEAGTMTVNGQVTGPVQIASSAVLEGNGRIVGNVNNNGIIAAGNSTTLDIQGDLSMETGSSLNVVAAPDSPTLLAVTGETSIGDDTSLVISLADADYNADTSVPILQSDGGIIGKFSEELNNMPLLGLSVLYSPTSMALAFSPEDFSSVAEGEDAVVLANYLDEIPSSEINSDLQRVINQLYSLPSSAELSSALDQLQPVQFSGFSLAQEEISVALSQNIFRRIEELVNQRACGHFCSGKRFLWENLFYVGSKQKKVSEHVPFTTDTEGVILGGNGTISEEIILGLGSAFSNTNIAWKEDRGKGQTLTGYLFIYGTGSFSPGFIRWNFMGELSHFQARRRIQFATIHRQANHSNNGHGFSGYIDFGILGRKHRAFAVNPFASINSAWFWENSYQEEEAESISLSVRKRRLNLWRFEVGLELSGCFETKKATISPNCKVFCAKEVRTLGKTFTARFTSVEPSFRVTGFNPNRDYLGFETYLDACLLDKLLSIRLGVNGQFAKKYQQYGGELNIGHHF